LWRRAAGKTRQLSPPAHPVVETCHTYDAAEAAEGAPVPTTEAKKLASSVTRSKQEITEDFSSIGGTWPPRPPKKRPGATTTQYHKEDPKGERISFPGSTYFYPPVVCGQYFGAGFVIMCCVCFILTSLQI